MTWEQVRELCPHRWVLVEVSKAQTRSAKRVIEDMVLVEAFENDWKPAWESYHTYHKENRTRELLILHTDREVLDIKVVNQHGVPVQEERLS